MSQDTQATNTAQQAASATQDAQQAAAQTQTTTAQQQAAQGQQAAAWDGKVESLPQGAQDLIKQLRGENAAKRTAAKAAEDDAQAKIAAALKALGIETGTEDPVEAAKQAKAERDAQAATARLAQVQLAVYKSAAKAGADADALLDSNSFLAAVSGLDPADSKALDAAIKTALESNPKLKAVQVAAKSGPEINGGTGGQGTAQSEIAAAIKAGDTARAISLTNQSLFKE